MLHVDVSRCRQGQPLLVAISRVGWYFVIFLVMFGCNRQSTSVLMAQLSDPDVTVRRTAASALSSLGPDGQDAIPALVKALCDQDHGVRMSSMKALGKICSSGADEPNSTGRPRVLGKLREQAVSGLATCLEDPQVEVRTSAAYQLARIGPPADSAIPGLVMALNDSNTMLRIKAATALATVDPSDARAITALIRELENKDRSVRNLAAVELGFLGQTASAAMPALRKALRDPEPFVQQGAAQALGMIQPEAAIDDLIAILSHALDGQGNHPMDGGDRILVVNNKQVCIQAAQSLGKAGPAAKAAVPVLIRALDTEADLKEAAVKTLGRIGPAAKVALPALRKMVHDPNRAVAEVSKQAIRQIDQ